MKVGDQIVCVRGSDEGWVIKNKIYTIVDIYECMCGEVVFNVGVMRNRFATICSCGKIYKPPDVWFHYSLFAPIEYNSATEELANKEIVKETLDVPIKIPEKA